MDSVLQSLQTAGGNVGSSPYSFAFCVYARSSLTREVTLLRVEYVKLRGVCLLHAISRARVKIADSLLQVLVLIFDVCVALKK